MSSIQVDRILMACVVLAIMGIVQFGCSLPFAVESYPGGTIHSTNTVGYSWSENWLSDLGRTEAWNGELNAESSVWFNRSVIILGISLAAFFVGSCRGFKEFSFAEAGIAFFGVSAATGLIGIGLTPADIAHDIHFGFLILWLLSMLVVAGIFTYQAILTGFWSGLFISTASIALMFSVMIYGLSAGTSAVMSMQKIVAMISISWLFLLVCRIGMTAFEVVTQIRGRRQLVNEQAVDYMHEISQDHRN